MPDVRRKLLSLLLSLIVGVSAGTASAAAQQDSVEIKGTVTLKISAISALYLNGSPEPAKDKACKKKFGCLMGQEVTTTFSVNTTTNMMSSTTTFESQTFHQSPLGIWGVYDFGAFFHPLEPPLNLYAALFSISLQFTDPVTTFILSLDESTNCKVSTK